MASKSIDQESSQNPGMAYFDQTQYGQSRWWAWLIGFWFFVVGWVIGQGVLLAPIQDMVGTIDPELNNQIRAANEAIVAKTTSEANVKKVALYGLGLLVTSLLTPIFWLINRNTKETAHRIFGWLTGIMAASSVIFATLLFPFFNDAEANALLTQTMGLSPSMYMLFLLTFPAGLAALYLVQKFILKRTILSLHTAHKHFRWNRAFQAALITLGLYGVISALLHVTGISPLKATFNSATFFGFALVSLLFIPLQSATEEIVVRGYMNQGFGHFIKNRYIVYFITSLFFMSLHLANPEAVEGASKGPFMFFITMSSYFLFGFILCLVVEIDGGLESAIGIHAGNNLFAAIFVNYENSALPVPSLFLSTPNPKVDIFIAIVMLFGLLYLMKKTQPTLERPLLPPGEDLNALS